MHRRDQVTFAKQMKDMRDDVVNFRVKVDLSQFYSDERKLSYVYIDKVKITNVLHLQTRIQNMFGIVRPLYLSINNVFLPVNEDIRIIKEDEVVVVQSSYPASNNATSTPDVSMKILENNDATRESISQCERYGSDSTDLEVSDNAKVNNCVDDIQIVDSLVVESEIPRRKRKRIRRRKKSNKNEQSSPPLNTQLNGSASKIQQVAKIDIDKSNSKHLKFRWDEFDGDQKQNNELKNLSSSKPTVRSTEITNLGTLLGLRNSQVPLTFSGQRRTRTNSGTSSLSIKSSTNNGSPLKVNGSTISTSSSPMDSNVNYSKINILEYPIHKEAFQVGDVMGFQTLILNEYYCPVLSDYIIAKVITQDLVANSYSCKILVGHDQLKTPEGKFALPTDNEEEGLTEKKVDNQLLFTLRHSDLNQPRLVHRITRH